MSWLTATNWVGSCAQDYHLIKPAILTAPGDTTCPENKIYLSPGSPGEVETKESGGSMGSPVAQPSMSCWPVRVGSLISQICSCLNMTAAHRLNEPQHNIRASSHAREDGAHGSQASPLFHCWLPEKNTDTNKSAFHLCNSIIPHSNVEQVENNRMLSLSSKENGNACFRISSVASCEPPALQWIKHFPPGSFLLA